MAQDSQKHGTTGTAYEQLAYMRAQPFLLRRSAAQDQEVEMRRPGNHLPDYIPGDHQFLHIYLMDMGHLPGLVHNFFF